MVEGRIVYDDSKGGWARYADNGLPTETNPGAIYAGFGGVSWGYLDDECDGIVSVELTVGGKALRAYARIGAGPPSFAPDGLPIRTVSDELEQAMLGPEVAAADVSAAEVEEIVRRAFETVRLLNTAVMNGNPVDGRLATASMMPAQDANDYHRMFGPIMAPTLVDNLSVVALHQTLLTALKSGTPAWFADVLRKPDEIGDLSDKGRRKMPAMMRGRRCPLSDPHPAADRHDPQVRRPRALFLKGEQVSQSSKISPRNLTAQLSYRGRGNPPVAHPSSAISNCFPGLEFDFRAIWRRIFVGIVLSENNNYVVDVEDSTLEHLRGRRLLKIDGRPVAVVASGPVIPGQATETLTSEANPDAVAFLEWSNTVALIFDKQGQQVACEFTERPSREGGAAGEPGRQDQDGQPGGAPHLRENRVWWDAGKARGSGRAIGAAG